MLNTDPKSTNISTTFVKNTNKSVKLSFLIHAGAKTLYDNLIEKNEKQKIQYCRHSSEI
jgi:hypothetical protein